MTDATSNSDSGLLTLDHISLLGYQRTNLFDTNRVSLIPNEPGVYILHFVKLGTFYVGSSSTIRKRAVSHKSEMLRGTHKNCNIQLSYSESGAVVDFYYRIYPAIEEALQVEHELINYFRQSTLICNLTPVASNNLVPMSEEQRELHSEAIKTLYINNPVLLQKHIDRLKRINSDPKIRQGRSDRKKAEWADPTKRAANIQKASERMTKQWENPELRAKRTKANQDRYTDPELTKKISETHKANWQNPEYKTHRNQINQKRLKDNPDIGKKIGSKLKNRWQDPVYRAEQTAKIRARNADPAYRAKLAKSARNRKDRKKK